MADFNYGIGIDRQRRKARGIAGLCAQTPLISLNIYAEKKGCVAQLSGKAEYMLPTGSGVDRAVSVLFADEEGRGTLKDGVRIVIEARNKETAVSLAALAASGGRRITLVVPEDMDDAKLSYLGADVIKCPEPELEAKVKDICAAESNCVTPYLSLAEANIRAGSESLAPELLRDTYGNLAAVVFYAEKASDVYGSSVLLKTFKSKVKVIAAVPEGIALDMADGIDEVISVSDVQAAEAVSDAAKNEGMLLGARSGAALYAAALVACRGEYKDKNIIAVLPDGGKIA